MTTSAFEVSVTDFKIGNEIVLLIGLKDGEVGCYEVARAWNESWAEVMEERARARRDGDEPDVSDNDPIGPPRARGKWWIDPSHVSVEVTVAGAKFVNGTEENDCKFIVQWRVPKPRQASSLGFEFQQSPPTGPGPDRLREGKVTIVFVRGDSEEEELLHDGQSGNDPRAFMPEGALPVLVEERGG